MCDGDYVFFMPMLTASQNFEQIQLWKRNQPTDAAAKEAFKHVYLVSFEFPFSLHRV